MQKIRKYLYSQFGDCYIGINVTLLLQKIVGTLFLAWFGLSLLAVPLELIVNRSAQPKRLLTKKSAATAPVKLRSQPEAVKKPIVAQVGQTTTAPTVKAAPSVAVARNKQPLLAEAPQSNPVVVTNTVKQQPSKATVSPYQFQMLVRIISAEAKGEPFHGQVAVGAVILNRIVSDRFPKTIAANVLKRGQFEPVANGSIWNEPVASAYRAARLALKGWDPTGGALYFFNPAKTSSRWIWSRPIVTRIGDHVFAV